MYQILQMREIGDKRGKLTVIENTKDIPFEIKRLFYIYDVGHGETRGNHANRASQFVLVCIAGNCKIEIDIGGKKETILMDKPSKALYLQKNIWKKMFDFSDDAILLVMSDREYDEDDYIYDYEEYVKSLSLERE